MKTLKFRKENIFWSIFIFYLSVVLMLSSFHLHSSRFNSWRSCSLFSPFGWVYSTSIPLSSSHSEFWFHPFHFPSRFFFFFFICSLIHNLCTLDFPMEFSLPYFLTSLWLRTHPVSYANLTVISQHNFNQRRTQQIV